MYTCLILQECPSGHVFNQKIKQCIHPVSCPLPNAYAPCNCIVDSDELFLALDCSGLKLNDSRASEILDAFVTASADDVNPLEELFLPLSNLLGLLSFHFAA